ncbi:MAG: DUF58 domain-containing protein [Clostridiales bacterium]|jgi:hypothetical protein|nr:DUF58 domain-containing protein [Clostridiales bacterium]
MKINRLLCIMFIIGSGVFASYFGGNISYALFYLAIFLPIISFLYTLYVYIRFKIYQSMDNYVVVKGDWNNYSFMIANEDYIAFRNVKVNFLYDKSTIRRTTESMEYSLLPSDTERMDTKLRCNYRGEYAVGVNTIEVTDFLYLFSITYPIATKLKVLVLPRIINVDQLGIAPSLIDPKNPVFFTNATEEELDTEVRKYNPGDNKKRIHWKASAKAGELLSRKYYQKPKAEVVLFMDLSKITEDDLRVVIAEDKIIESILAIANYYAIRKTSSHIIYDMDGIRNISIYSKGDFNAFYKTCVNIKFNSKTSVAELMTRRLQRGDDGIFYVVATAKLTKELYLSSLKVLSGGNRLCILFISDDISEDTKKMIEDMKRAGADIHQIMPKDEIEDVLTGEY